MKTRGPNPNPTAQAQSKRCLPLSTKTQNIIDFVSISTTILDDFFEHFYKSGSRGPGPHPKVPTRHQHGPQGYPNGAQGCRNESQGLPKVPKSLPTIFHVCQNGSPRCHNGANRPPKVVKRHHKALQSATKTQKTCTIRPRPGARRRRRRSGRGLEGRAHQAACRSLHRGSEVQVHKGFVLEVN